MKPRGTMLIRKQHCIYNFHHKYSGCPKTKTYFKNIKQKQLYLKPKTVLLAIVVVEVMDKCRELILVKLLAS